LERYFVDQGRAKRDNDRNVSAVYVLVDTAERNRIAGYFTISNTSLLPAEMPATIAKKLNRYDRWGAVKLGRMARHDDFPKLGLGDILLARAFSVALSIADQSGSLALVVDAKNDRLAQWYAAAGFQAFPDAPLRLFIVNLTMAAYLEQMAEF
jgi:hypothetical protein